MSSNGGGKYGHGGSIIIDCYSLSFVGENRNVSNNNGNIIFSCAGKERKRRGSDSWVTEIESPGKVFVFSHRLSVNGEKCEINIEEILNALSYPNVSLEW